MLHERLETLEEEKRVTEEMLEESRNMVEILKVSPVSVPLLCHHQLQAVPRNCNINYI
jgi:hypothetical protein